MLFCCLPVVSISSQVATLAGAEFMTIVQRLETDDDRMKLASDWSVSVDVLLTELKDPSLFLVCFCFWPKSLSKKRDLSDQH